MMVPGGLTMDTGLTIQPGSGATADAAPDMAFTQVLAALDAATLTVPTTTPAPAPGAVVTPPVPGLVVAAPVALTRNAPEAPSNETEVNEAASDEDAGSITSVAPVATPPFIAPPITIAVVSAGPIVTQPEAAPQLVDGTQVATQPAQAIAVKAAPTATVDAGSEADEAAGAPPVARAFALLAGQGLSALAVPETREVARPAPAPAPALTKAQVEVPTTTPQIPTPAAASTSIDAQPQSADTSQPVVTSLPAPVAAAAPASTMPVSSTIAEAAPSDTAQRLGEQSVLARLDVANEAQMIDRLARDIAQLSGAEGRLKFQLNPEHLGSLHVEVEHRAEGVSLRFGTETEGARQVIADAQHRLVNEARAQGMRIAETHVDVSSQNHPGGNRGGQTQQPLSSVVITRGEAADAAAGQASPKRTGPVERFA